MVAEGIQHAMKNPPTSILDEHHQETTNYAEENVNIQKKLNAMHNLVKQMQDQMAQQQPPYSQQGYKQPYNHQPYYHQQQYQPFTDRTNTYNSYQLQRGCGRNYNYNNTNTHNHQGRNNRGFYCWAHGQCNHPGPDCQSKM
eukprot:15325961-Ditylum_brightwellii.AAC.1